MAAGTSLAVIALNSTMGIVGQLRFVVGEHMRPVIVRRFPVRAEHVHRAHLVADQNTAIRQLREHRWRHQAVRNLLQRNRRRRLRRARGKTESNRKQSQQNVFHGAGLYQFAEKSKP